jgi:GNAT superfamily N-acetyltransferase
LGLGSRPLAIIYRTNNTAATLVGPSEISPLAGFGKTQRQVNCSNSPGIPRCEVSLLPRRAGTARYGLCMDVDLLSIIELKPKKKRIYWHVFEPSDRFLKPWWRREDSINGNEHWLSFERGGAEVARCKFILDEEPRSHPNLGNMPFGQLDILALEVAAGEQRRGIGRKVLLAIREMHPLPRLTALNDNALSRGFWDREGWVRHESKWGFTSERVTYSER